jgi:SAM-dependent methyltransferase
LLEYFQTLVREDPPETAAAKVDWRISCFEQGAGFVEYLEEHVFPVAGKRVFDASCAWGGHAAAFAEHGARVFAADLNEHSFDDFQAFCRNQRLDIRLAMANCEYIPVRDEQVDVVLALELVEHIESVERFAGEVARILRPGGVCIVSTPARLRSFIEGEPHYGLRGLTVLPLAAQRWVATRLFGKSYPYPIPRQYAFASSVLRPFDRRGLVGWPVLRGSWAQRIARHPAVMRSAAAVVWNFIVIQKPIKAP